MVAACGGAQDVANSPPAQRHNHVRAIDDWFVEWPAEQPELDLSGAQQLPSGFGSGPPGSGLGRFYHQHVTWTDCGGGDTCADIWVPLDYSAPNGLAITLKAKRDPATDQSHKVGSLFINPGGPGASGIDVSRVRELRLSDHRRLRRHRVRPARCRLQHAHRLRQ